MSRQDPSSPVLERVEWLIMASERNDITAEQVEELNRTLRDVPEARRFYVRYMLETANLRAWAASMEHEANQATLHAGHDRVFSAEGPTTAQGAPFASLPHLGDVWSGSIGFFSHGWPLAYLLATIISAAALWIAWLLPATHPVGDLAQGPKQTAQPSSDLAPPLVARITGMVDCQWAQEGRPPIGYDFVPVGRQFQLDAGFLQIRYDSGATIILEGPCTYTVESPAAGYLTVGKLTARVEKSGEARGEGRDVSCKVQDEECKLVAADPRSTIHYPLSNASSPLSPLPSSLFTVRTPSATVTDLGTEFGVHVTDEGATEAQVFAGSVRFDAEGERTAGQVLTAGQIARISRESIEIAMRSATETDTRHFARSMPAPRRARQADAYAGLVLGMNPAAYYRMDRSKAEADRNVLVDSAPGSFDAIYQTGRGFRDVYGQGQFGHALWFGGPGSGDYAIVRHYPKTTTGQISVSAWVYAESRPIWASIAKNWGRMKHGQFFLGLTADDGDLSVYVQDKKGKDVSVREGREASFPLRRWQHVAFVADGHTLRLYRNGGEVGSAEVDGIQPAPAAESLGIGVKPDDSGDRPVSMLSDCWHGWIDELALFHRALTSEEIAELARQTE